MDDWFFKRHKDYIVVRYNLEHKSNDINIYTDISIELNDDYVNLSLDTIDTADVVEYKRGRYLREYIRILRQAMDNRHSLKTLCSELGLLDIKFMLGGCGE